MFGDVGFGELLGLALLALVLVGPDRLPTVAADAAKWLKRLKSFAVSATDQLKDNLGPGYEDLKPEDLHPKNFIRKQIAEAMSDQPTENEMKHLAKLDPDML